MRALGYIKLSRKLFDGKDPLWDDGTPFDTRSAWTDVIQMTAFAPHKRRGGDRLERGEFVASVRFLAERWKWSKSAVQRWLAARVAMGHITPKIGTEVGQQPGHHLGHHGLVYRVVNYDRYQSSENGSGTPNGTGDEMKAGHQPRKRGTNKKAVVKKALETTGASAPDSEDPVVRFPVLACNAIFDRWVQRRGNVNYGHLRNALLPSFPAVGALYTLEQLLAAVDAFAELAEIDRPEFSQKWNVQKFAGELPRWVKLGALPYVDSWGTPTERAIACKLFAPDLPPSGRYVA